MTDKKPQYDKMINLINKLNRDIQRFIQESLGSSFNIEKWGPISNDFETIKCWKITGCRKKECPAYDDMDYRCWLKTGTLCDGKIQGEFAKKYKTCFECEVFKAISEKPLRLLYENINTLIFHIKAKSLKLQELAIKDQLTGLYNRHFFSEVIEREVARTDRNAEPLSFIVIDIDYFKQINDKLGHLTGDKILIETASLIKKTFRKADLLFRFGGDEFLIVLPNTDCAKSTNMVERLLTLVASWNKGNEDTYGCNLSFSIGLSICEKECDFHKALKEADDKMYQNKIEKRMADSRR